MENNDTPSLGDVLHEIGSDAKDFWHAQRHYTLLIVSEKAAKAGRKMVGGSILLGLIAITLLLLSMAGAYLIGECVGSVAMGFLYLGGAYLALTLIFLVLWKSLLGKKVELNIINEFHDQD